MNCERARQVEMDEELKPTLLRELLRHQEDCSDCRRLAEEHTRLLQLLDDWKLDAGFGAGFDARLEQRLAREHRQPSRWSGWSDAGWGTAGRWLWPLRAPLAGAAFALALLLSAGTLFRGGMSPVAPTPITAVAQADPLMRDLQVLDRDGDLLANFDFLSAQTTATTPMTEPHSDQD